MGDEHSFFLSVWAKLAHVHVSLISLRLPSTPLVTSPVSSAVLLHSCEKCFCFHRRQSAAFSFTLVTSDTTPHYSAVSYSVHREGTWGFLCLWCWEYPIKLHCRTCFKNHSEQDYSFFTPILKQWEQLPTMLLTKHYMPISLYEELDRCPLSSMCLRGLETHTTADKPNVYITKSVSVHVFDRDLAFCPIFPFCSALKGTCFFHQSWEEGRKSW